MEWVVTLKSRRDRKIWLLVVHLEIETKMRVLSLNLIQKDKEMLVIIGQRRFQGFSVMMLLSSTLKAQSNSKQLKKKDLRNNT